MSTMVCSKQISRFSAADFQDVAQGSSVHVSNNGLQVDHRLRFLSRTRVSLLEEVERGDRALSRRHCDSRGTDFSWARHMCRGKGSSKSTQARRLLLAGERGNFGIPSTSNRRHGCSPWAVGCKDQGVNAKERKAINMLCASALLAASLVSLSHLTGWVFVIHNPLVPVDFL
ncbi:uncharacterized protein BCR38DRAFT_410763 [Pseudomassariella vexata]|uniref:Uncharacterized protein n=1 Tax=Pseudomassariella vexata TaxID=1141098 RepID=A0A1Y2DUL1_9PEZI|nr:uncharacterized protein BCR38DRAFT_410763 [Pseudomassariella vexata]ORY62335.1 hypothetical protein BCR38DRAFT_410763 [Pseudomassariella vexata]